METSYFAQEQRSWSVAAVMGRPAAVLRGADGLTETYSRVPSLLHSPQLRREHLVISLAALLPGTGAPLPSLLLLGRRPLLSRWRPARCPGLCSPYRCAPAAASSWNVPLKCLLDPANPTVSPFTCSSVRIWSCSQNNVA